MVVGTRGMRMAMLVGVVVLAAGLMGCARDATPSRWMAPGAPANSGAGAGAPAPSADPSPSGHTTTTTTTTTTITTKASTHQPNRSGRFDGPANSVSRTGGPGIALTFDDGPDPAQTPKILDLLAARHVKATFCLVGRNVEAHPELVRRIVAAGHTVCNHTWQHSLTIGQQSPAAIRADLQRTNDAIRRAAPTARITYMRAPGGNFTPALVAMAADLGMTSVYWQVDPRDWDHPAGESHAAHQARIIRAVKTHTHKGSIVLSHDFGQPDTIAAYRTLIPWLQQRFTLIALP
jgi:peptidoglycan/xylan/chitin deacetylase (PgdA/CDA1 family)